MNMNTEDLVKLEVHPAAFIMPTMEEADFMRLAEDIERNGVHTPIVTYEGKLLDGRHRLRAAHRIGINSLDVIEYTRNDPAGFVLSLNLQRRQLTTGQRALVAANLMDYEREQAKVRQATHQEEDVYLSLNSDEAGRATELAGKKVGVGKDSVQKALVLISKAADGDATATAVLAKVKKGEYSLNQAVQTVKPPAVFVANPERILEKMDKAYDTYYDLIEDLFNAKPDETHWRVVRNSLRNLMDLVPDA